VKRSHAPTVTEVLLYSLVDESRKVLPVVFAGPSIDALTGDAINWGTVQNKRCRREIPDECFARSGNGPTLVIRDPFLTWWATTLRDARQPFGTPPPTARPQPRAGRRSSARAEPAAADEPTALAAAPE
jgi:hypothetical protein